jgi:hypothetical protein
MYDLNVSDDLAVVERDENLAEILVSGNRALRIVGFGEERIELVPAAAVRSDLDLPGLFQPLFVAGKRAQVHR